MDFYRRECDWLSRGNHARRARAKICPCRTTAREMRRRISLTSFSATSSARCGASCRRQDTTTRNSSRRWKTFAKDCSSKKPRAPRTGRIRRLLIQAKTFGAHLAELDFRDHSGKLDNAEAELLEEFRAIARNPKGIRRAGREPFHRQHDAQRAAIILRLFKLSRAARAFMKFDSRAAVRDDRGSGKFVAKILGDLWSDVEYRRHLQASRPRAGSDGRLFGFQQGRRLPRGELVFVSRAKGDVARGRRMRREAAFFPRQRRHD